MLELSNRIENFNKLEWRKICDIHMLLALKAKFLQNKDLGSFLKSTGECVLVGANPRDKILEVRFIFRQSRHLGQSKWCGNEWTLGTSCKGRQNLQ